MRPNGDLVSELHTAGIGRSAQRQRRSRILATTRQLIGQHGRKGFVLRQVAEMCEVSIQTIYNLVGDRSRVLGEAVSEVISASFVYAGRNTSYPVRFLALADVYWATAVAQPEYIRYATLDYFSSDTEYRELVRSGAVRMFNDALTSMKRKGDLRPSADTHAMAHRFSCLAAAMVFDWANGARTLEELHADLLDGHALLLRDALTPATAELVEQWRSSRKALGPVLPS